MVRNHPRLIVIKCRIYLENFQMHYWHQQPCVSFIFLNIITEKNSYCRHYISSNDNTSSRVNVACQAANLTDRPFIESSNRHFADFCWLHIVPLTSWQVEGAFDMLDTVCFKVTVVCYYITSV